jgi:hypothetical protein
MVTTNLYPTAALKFSANNRFEIFPFLTATRDLKHQEGVKYKITEEFLVFKTDFKNILTHDHDGVAFALSPRFYWHPSDHKKAEYGEEGYYHLRLYLDKKFTSKFTISNQARLSATQPKGHNRPSTYNAYYHTLYISPRYQWTDKLSLHNEFRIVNTTVVGPNTPNKMQDYLRLAPGFTYQVNDSFSWGIDAISFATHSHDQEKGFAKFNLGLMPNFYYVPNSFVSIIGSISSDVTTNGSFDTYSHHRTLEAEVDMILTAF